MENTSAYKLLYLLNLLARGKYTKSEILDEFLKKDIKLTKQSINNYINKYLNNDILIEVEIQNNKEKLYSLKKEKYFLEFTQEELDVISEIKKILYSKKDYNLIRKTMRLFYKLAKYIKDDNTRLEFINFDYFSTINWNLVLQLEKHSKNKDIIVVDYILNDGKNELIEIHSDCVKIGEWSDRIYFKGYIPKRNIYYSLPVDKIFMIKKIVKRNVSFDYPQEEITYIVDEKIYKETKKDTKEIIIDKKDNKLKIKRPIDDDFYIIQRLMYFCPNIYYISDERIKKLVKEKLEILRGTYDKN